jgi:hypothetical protein
LYASNAGRVDLADVLYTLLAVTIFSALCWLVLYILIRNRVKSAILTSIFLFLFFSYKNITDSLQTLTNAYSAGVASSQAAGTEHLNLGLLAGLSILFILLVFLVAKTSKDLARINHFLNYVSLLAVLVVSVQIIQAIIGRPAVSRDKIRGEWEAYLAEQPQLRMVSGTLPDIYWVILDAYARQDVLQEYYGFDNSSFLQGLKQRNFYVAAESNTNYIWTYLSLTSTMNSMYLDDLSGWLRNNSTWGQTIDLVTEKSLLFEQLRRLGYRVIAFSDPYELMDITSADFYLSTQTFHLGQFQNEMIAKTPLPVIFNYLPVDLQFDTHRKSIDYFFKELARIPQVEQPTITIAHVILPHPPFVFDADGAPLRPDAYFSIRDGDRYYEPQDRSEYVLGFVNQTMYTNRRVLESLDEIIKDSPTPPIIILQSDHGPASLFDPYKVENTNLDERLGILAAFYFPDQNYSSLYPTISPVNIFRVVFNQYFGGDYRLLPDNSFYSPFDDLLDFSDVTP